MRYFKTSNASRQYRAGGLLFTFEPVENVGGTWSGLLAVEDDSAASQISSAGLSQITEITKDEYEALKKKPTTPNSSFRDSLPRATSSPQLAVAAPAAATPSSSKTPAPAKPTATLKTGKIDVPDELAQSAAAGKPRRR